MSALDKRQSVSHGVSIAKAKPDDALALTALVASAYTKYIDRMGKKPAPMLVNYAKLIDGAEQDVFVLRLKETVFDCDDDSYGSSTSQLVGSIILADVPDGEGSIRVNSLVVDPLSQGSGYGRALMEYAEEVARARGYRTVILYTHVKMTENIGYYTKLGYRETDRRTEDGFDRVYFRKDLA